MTRVPGNDWTALAPARPDGETPTLRVTVCVPCRNPSLNLERVLDAIEEQDYPLDLVDVVVADDGSETPVVLEPRPFPTQVVRLERTLDFGAGRARNAAAAAATGEILVFFDGDVMPERQVLARYTRWFHSRRDVLVQAPIRFADVEHLSRDELRALVASGEIAAELGGHEVDDQDWREKLFARTDDLLTEAVGAFLSVVGATFAVSAEQYAAAGGFREVGLRGIEDSEFGYRVHADGAVLVLDREAGHWHQGRRSLSGDRKAEINARRLPYIERLVPVRRFRKEPPVPLDDPVACVPRTVVHAAPGPDAEERSAALRALVPADCVVVVGDADPAPVFALGAVPFVPAFCHVYVPATARLTDASVGRLARELEGGAGAVVVAARGEQPVVAVRTRARRRAEREAPGTPLLDAVGKRFDVRTVPGPEVGVDWRGLRSVRRAIVRKLRR